MKTITSIPSHYRRLSSDEVIRKGDLFQYITEDGKPVIGDCQMGVGKTPKECNGNYLYYHTYYRRRHVKVKESVPQVVKMTDYPSKSPLVSFDYPSKFQFAMKFRSIRLIAANDKYLVGLDVNDSFKFKKFLRSKARNLNVVEFNVNVLK